MFNLRSLFYLTLILSASLLVSSCNLFCDLLFSSEETSDNNLIGHWLELSPFPGYPREGAVSFVINDIAYLGSGYDGDNYLSDFWAYDRTTNNWTQVASIGSTDDSVYYPRWKATAFTSGSKGYVGTGYNGETNLNDFWEFNPNTNEWTQKTDFPGSARYGTIGFAIENKGYIGTGYDGSCLNDFYEYCPSTDTWQKISNMSGTGRKEAAVFVIDDTAYVCIGIDNNGTYLSDLWKFHPSFSGWKELRGIEDISDEGYDDDYDIVRKSAVAFSIGSYGYIATGGTTGNAGTDCWQYNPVEDLWEEKHEFEGTRRFDAVGFAIGYRGYLATGKNSDMPLSDLWGFDPWEDPEDYD